MVVKARVYSQYLKFKRYIMCFWYLNANVDLLNLTRDLFKFETVQN